MAFADRNFKLDIFPILLGILYLLLVVLWAVGAVLPTGLLKSEAARL
jgi:hypothetical protein